MGLGMVANLVRGGHDVTVWNRTRKEVAGANVAATPKAAVAGADVVLTMLADDAAVESVVFGADGFADALPADAAHVSHSTISVGLSQKLAAAHTDRGQLYVAAPVFGRPDAAAGAKLVIAAAGSADAIARVQPLFDIEGRKTFTVGSEPWQANMVKVCGNFMIASMLETFSEAAAVMRKSEIDPGLFLEIINGLFQSPVYENYGKAIVNQKFDSAGFALKLGLKDVRLVLAASESVEAPMPLASLLRDRFLSAVARGQGQLDWSAVSKIAAADAGLEKL